MHDKIVLEKGCWERGCACYDYRFDEGVEVAVNKEWVSLSDEDIKEIVGQWGETPIKGYTRQLFDKIDAKYREKNT